MALIHAILVSLTDCPSSGYDLAKRFDGSVGFFWDASHQQIYRELAKLEDAGYLHAEKIEQDTRPNKKIYSVTPSGQALLRKWMAQPTDPSPPKDDLLVKLFGGYLVPAPVLIAELEHHRQQHQARLAEYRTIQGQFFPDPHRLSREKTYQYLTLRSGIQFERGWLNWCEEAIAILQNLCPEPPGLVS